MTLWLKSVSLIRLLALQKEGKTTLVQVVPISGKAPLVFFGEVRSAPFLHAALGLQAAEHKGGQ